ncbi:helix-turn-helix domain-containing protein [Streptomyces cinerochromogenes]|uniref:helix-turn-helix domain-containing protein n=1 Tax=Streptomyces cinerochromogenes TaxID=66422 RepID=UPI0036C3C4E1
MLSAPAARKRKWMTGGAREEPAQRLARECEDGQSFRDPAEAHGQSYGFVHRVLTEAEVPPRSRGRDVHSGTTRPVR